MRPIAVIDAETDPFKAGRIPRPFVWGYYNGSEYHQFTETAALADFLSDREEIVFAHNGGKFDFHFMLDYLEPYQGIMLINGRIVKARLGAAELRDSYSIIPAPLSAYKKDDIDYSLFEVAERCKPANWKKITDYLRTDCVYLWDLVTRFVTDYGLHITQASSAMKQWQKMAPIEVPKTSAEYYAELAPYYFGGRVQCFERGIIETAFKVFDINSAYPRAMMEKHPYSDTFASYSEYHPMADFLDVECTSRGAFPYRGENGGLFFPDDDERRLFRVTKWEYDAAIDTCTIENVLIVKSLVFTGHMDFSEYINHFWTLRKAAKEAGDDAGSLLYKLAMNSLYGKFAANPDNYREYMIFPPERGADLSGTGWEFSGELGPWVLGEAELSSDRKRYYNVATGASITGYVRAMLWRAICASDGVLYCDTDSIAARAATLDEGPNLGQWKDEGTFDKAGIAGKKMYIFRGIRGKGGKREYKTASKGVRLTNAELWKVARGKEVIYNPENPTFSAKTTPKFISRKVQQTY